MQRSIAAITFIIFTMIGTTMAAVPIASIDRSVIAIDDTLTLTIRINDGGSYTGPDLNPVKTSFYVLGNSQSSRHMIRNGKSESWTEWVITLMPKRKGRLEIPAINVDGQRTQPISISVQPSIPTPGGTLEPVFLESEVDTSSVYVQQQIIFTLRIFQSVQLDNMNITEPEFDNAAMEKLGQNSFQRRIQNSPYRVHELRYAIYPQETGDFIIPEMMFSANEAMARRSAFSLPGQGKRIRKMTQQHKIKVKAPPPSFSGDTWLPAKSVKLIETWSNSPGNIYVGDSITRTITIEADGLLDSQLPPLSFSPIEGAKFYPDKGSSETSVTDKGSLSSRADSAAIIPTREGEIILPEIRLQWWDTKRNKMQEAVIPASTLLVKPALNGTQGNSTPLAMDHSLTAAKVSTVSADSQTADNLLWQVVAAGFALAWLLTLYLWWQLKSKGTIDVVQEDSVVAKSLSEQQTFGLLSQTCRDNDIHEVRTALVNWARAYWPEQNIQSLQDIQAQSDHPSLNTALAQLDNVLYGNQQDSSGWHGESLLSVIKLVRENGKNKSTKAAGLKPLYSN